MSTSMMLGLLMVAQSVVAQVPEVSTAVEEKARFRAGVSLASGVFVAGLTPELGLTARAGVQVDRRWALLGEVGFVLGLPREQYTRLGYGHVALIGEATFADQ